MSIIALKQDAIDAFDAEFKSLIEKYGIEATCIFIAEYNSENHTCILASCGCEKLNSYIDDIISSHSLPPQTAQAPQGIQ